MKLGFIGFGGAGYGLAKGLKEAGLVDLYFFDRMQDEPPFAEVIARRSAEVGVQKVATPAELLSAVEVVISCVTGAMAVSVAQEAAPYLKSRHLYVDVNTASPAVKEETGSIVEETGASFCDAAMMGAVPQYLHKVPILASGRGAEPFYERLSPYGMNIRIVGARPGQAAAIKLFRSIFMKGLLALFLEMLTATHRFGVDDVVLSSLAESLDGQGFREIARLQVTKGAVNAERMAHEMQDVISTLEEMGAPAVMSKATKEKLLWCARFALRERFGGDLPGTLEEVLAVIAPPTSADVE